MSPQVYDRRYVERNRQFRQIRKKWTNGLASDEYESIIRFRGRETCRDSKLIGRRLRVRRFSTSFFARRSDRSLASDETQAATDGLFRRRTDRPVSGRIRPVRLLST